MTDRLPWQGPVDVETVPPTLLERIEAAAILIAVFSVPLLAALGGAWIILAYLGALLDAFMACGGGNG